MLIPYLLSFYLIINNRREEFLQLLFIVILFLCMCLTFCYLIGHWFYFVTDSKYSCLYDLHIMYITIINDDNKKFVIELWWQMTTCNLLLFIWQNAMTTIRYGGNRNYFTVVLDLCLKIIMTNNIVIWYYVL